MDTWATVLAVVGGLLGLTAAAGGLAVWFKGSYTKARIEALRSDITDYERREVVHEKDMLEAQGKISALEIKVAKLEEERDMLRELATQRAAVAELASEVRDLIVVLKEHHDASAAAWVRIEQKVEGGPS